MKDQKVKFEESNFVVSETPVTFFYANFVEGYCTKVSILLVRCPVKVS